MCFEEIKQELEIDIDYYLTVNIDVTYHLSSLCTMVYGLWKFQFITLNEYQELYKLIDDAIEVYKISVDLPF